MTSYPAFASVRVGLRPTRRLRQGRRPALNQRHADRGRRHHAPHRPTAVVLKVTPGDRLARCHNGEPGLLPGWSAEHH